VLTRDDRVHQRIKIHQDRGNLAYPLSELQAAAILPQLEMLDAFHLRRRQAAQRLIDLMRDDVELPAPSSNEHNSPVYYKFPLILPAESRDPKCAQAQHRGIPLFPGFRGFATRSSRRCRVIGSLDNSLRFATQTALLHHAALLLDDAELTRLASVLCSILKE
jgi:perosamine synthetase